MNMSDFEEINEETGLAVEESGLEAVEETKEESLDDLLRRINGERDDSADYKSFTVISDIGKRDYRYFFYYSSVLKTPWILAMYILLPLVLAGFFSAFNGGFSVPVFIIMALILYLFLGGLVVFKTERSLAKINKKSPETLMTTRTRFTFAYDAIIHTKNGETLNIKYNTMKSVRKTKRCVIIYFFSNKAMVIHNDDIEKVMPVDQFAAFIDSKIKK